MVSASLSNGPAAPTFDHAIKAASSEAKEHRGMTIQSLLASLIVSSSVFGFEFVAFLLLRNILVRV